MHKADIVAALNEGLADGAKAITFQKVAYALRILVEEGKVLRIEDPDKKTAPAVFEMA